jgi:hypothetical protein
LKRLCLTLHHLARIGELREILTTSWINARLQADAGIWAITGCGLNRSLNQSYSREIHFADKVIVPHGQPEMAPLRICSQKGSRA